MAKMKPTSETDWQARSDMQTLVDAEAIKRDPKRLAAAKKCAKEKLESIATVVATTASE